MTTPLCNAGCEENMGWEAETSWPYSASTKAQAQSIYCLSGLPKVPPRSVFGADYADAREDVTVTNYSLGSSGSVANISGVIPTTLVVSNTTAYDMDVFGIWTGNASMEIVGTAVYTFQTKIYNNNVFIPSSTATSVQYGNNATAGSGWRQMKNDAFKFLLTLAPGGVANLTIKTTWSLTSGTAGTSKMNNFTSALRVITGNTL